LRAAKHGASASHLWHDLPTLLLGHNLGGHETRPSGFAETGYGFFPYAAQYSGQWWVLRLNHGFPEHDMYTVFIDGSPVADITASPEEPSPLVAGAASLQPFDSAAAEAQLDAETAAAVVQAGSRYVN
jgi:hypothetical protein